jgi:hypothetical protein
VIQTGLEIIVCIIILAFVVMVIAINHSLRGGVSSRSIRRDERYERLREVHKAGGIANQEARNEQARIGIINHHLKGITRRDYRRAEAGNPKAEAKIENANRLANFELQIFDNKIVKGHRAATRIHPGTGQSHGGIRREAAPKKSISLKRPSKPSKPAKELPKWRRPIGS